MNLQERIESYLVKKDTKFSKPKTETVESSIKEFEDLIKTIQSIKVGDYAILKNVTNEKLEGIAGDFKEILSTIESKIKKTK